MSSIEENAFQIARYLANNNHTSINKVKKGDVRNALSLSPEDFHNAVIFLSSQEYCMAGLGGDTDSIWIKSGGILFVKNEKKERDNISLNAEFLLKYLASSQTPRFPFSLAGPTIKQFGWDENEYVLVAQELSDKGFVRGEYASGNPFFKISTTQLGREAVRNNFRLPTYRISDTQAKNKSINVISHNPIHKKEKMEKDSLEQISIFVASPSDVANERKKLEAVVNSLKPTANHFGLILRVVDWHVVVPDAGIAQQIIFDQLKPTSWDIFVGILWHRFGTPPGMKDKTGKDYLSGTEAEFKVAYELWKHNGRPRIMLYRCKRAIPSNADLMQAQCVKDFFDEIENPKSEFRVFTKSFTTQKSFEEIWRNDLQELLAFYDKESKTQ